MKLCQNSEIVHSGQRYHVQTESWEPKEPLLVSQVFCGGKVVYSKKQKGEAFTPEQVLLFHQEVISSIKELLI